MSTNFNNSDDFELDKQLRPSTFDEYIGQQQVKKNLEILISAASQRGETPEHVLFYGPPGIGKTTLATLIAKQLNANLKTTSGSAIEKVGDLAAILTNLDKGDVLFIDEIHRLKKPIEEVLYPAMESGVIDLVVGAGPSARVMQISLEPFTLVCATTLMSKISAPLRSRFSGGVFHLGYYEKDEIAEIIRQNASKLEMSISPDAVEILADNSRFTPRYANYLLKRVRDYAQVHKKQITPEVVYKTLELLGIYEYGLTKRDIEILHTIQTQFSGGPVGLKTLSIATSEEPETIEQIHEPYLIQIGFLKKSSRGRHLTKQAQQFLDEFQN